jgi:hypothetical protein
MPRWRANAISERCAARTVATVSLGQNLVPQDFSPQDATEALKQEGPDELATPMTCARPSRRDVFFQHMGKCLLWACLTADSQSATFVGSIVSNLRHHMVIVSLPFAFEIAGPVC